MTNLTLMRFLLVGATVPMLAAAQKPIPGPRPEPRSAPKFELLHSLDVLEDMRFDADHMAMLAKDAVSSLDIEAIKLQAQHAAMEAKQLAMLDMEHVKLEMDHSKLASDAARMALENLKFDTKFSSELPGPMPFKSADRLMETRPRAPWLREDPADSLYRIAREALNRGEYRRAAQLFNEVTRKYSTSGYAQPSAYWEAFARYRLGTTEDLKQALRILEGKGEFKFEFASMSRGDNGIDVPSLRARIQGALAARGDQQAQRDLQREAAESGGCDREEVSVRAEALAALGQMDLAAAMPTVRKVLLKRDECTVELRRRALYLLGREPIEPNLAILIDVARNDTDANIRGEAMSWIARSSNDQAVPLFEELLRTSTDERTQRSAISALATMDSDRARRAVRTIIERNDAPERVRYDAIVGLSRSRHERMPTADDVAYLRSLYTKLESHKLREAVVTAVGRIPTADNQAFLMAIVRNQNEQVSLRSSALQRLVANESYKVEDIAKLYDIADARSLREQVLYGLSRRKEPEAIDKMMEIARRDTDPQIRRTAVSLLARSNNERAKKYLQELIDR